MITPRILFTAVGLLIAGIYASSLALAADQARPCYRGYAAADVAAKLQGKVAELEKRFGVGDAPEKITPPTFKEVPRPFSIDLRRGRSRLSIAVFAVIDPQGKTLECVILDASDEVVAKEAGAIMCAAKYAPARMGKKAVQSAAIFEIEGAGIPK